MAKHSSKVIIALQEIAAKEADLAAEALARAIKAAEEADGKHEMLHQYRDDYIKNQNGLMESGMGAEVYRNFQNFLNKLNQAISGQKEVAEFAKRQVQVQRELWQESQRKKLSYEVLAKRTDQRVLKAELKKDQKMMDEFASRASSVKYANHATK